MNLKAKVILFSTAILFLSTFLLGCYMVNQLHNNVIDGAGFMTPLKTQQAKPSERCL
ncbi:hypothetical protein PP175_11770 [Aneurinibacillus sp. Ricciae_BoGa-3]|uniref:hypothetical protein n=1 Tax=Aneurinibacillus sp. Ricciae_BoGa-3 TaxID=3022697 RepID=UPI00234156BC|nr:hypothetical protein [Aneurinibacillus sp. Ricciae_BoGa-3]WCK56523.1 hypothetical protein PP175_11770 [Aneurinibacillus sp. Ricciae_BoGa-3]